MSRIKRSIVMSVLAVSLLVSSSPIAASSRAGDWSMRQIRILCEGHPPACPCPSC